MSHEYLAKGKIALHAGDVQFIGEEYHVYFIGQSIFVVGLIRELRE